MSKHGSNGGFGINIKKNYSDAYFLGIVCMYVCRERGQCLDSGGGDGREGGLQRRTAAVVECGPAGVIGGKGLFAFLKGEGKGGKVQKREKEDVRVGAFMCTYARWKDEEREGRCESRSILCALYGRWT